MVVRVDVRANDLRAEVRFPGPLQSDDDNASAAALAGALPFVVASPIQMQRRGNALRLVLQGAAARAPDPDPRLIRMVIQARIRAADYLEPNLGLTISDIARREGADVGDVSRAMQLAFLAPDLLARILDGTLPQALTAERLKRAGELPLLWEDQRALFD